MASKNKRMFSMDIIDSDDFLDLPASSQNLYFHLNMRADDDGFITPKKIMRMIGSSDDDYKILVGKRFLIEFENSVCVIKHWLIHNTIRQDRYFETKYLEEKNLISKHDNGSYIIGEGKSIENKLPVKKLPNWEIKRKEAYSKSILPKTFSKLMREKFIGEDCPICHLEMRHYKDLKLRRANYNPTIQHNKPISQGGEHDIDNISVICGSCNYTIGTKESDELNNDLVKSYWLEISSAQVRQPRIDKDKDKEEIKIKEKVKTVEQADKPANQVNEYIEELKELNPIAYTKWFKNKTQRENVELLIKRFTINQLRETVSFIKLNENVNFFPSISTPMELVDKLQQVKRFYKTKGHKKKEEYEVIP